MGAAELFSEFAELCEELTRTSGKNLKVQLISAYVKRLEDDRSLEAAVLFLSGSVFPKGSGMAINVGFKTIMDSLSNVARLQPHDIQQIYLQHGDLGALAEYAVTRKMQSTLAQRHLVLAELHAELKKLAGITGSGAAATKSRILTGLLINCSPVEAKYLVKLATGEMRIGVVEGIVEVAVAAAFGRELGQLRKALLLTGDLSQVAILAKKDRLGTSVMKPLVPLSFMLADVMFSAEEIANYYGARLICESKYDGVRVQLHKAGRQVKLFSRKLDDITASFPEVADAARASILQNDVILDGELMAYKNGRPLHFQQLQKRLRRKQVTVELKKAIPVVYVPYDVLFLEKPVIDLPLLERKKLLSGLHLREPPLLDLGYSMVSTAEQIAAAFDRSREMGHEGLVLKEPDSQYHPGKRGRHWAKLKRELDTVDAVIVAAEYGHGKRAGTLSDYTFAVRDEGNRLLTIGKAYSGLTDKEIAEMTQKLQSIALKDKGYRLEVRPEIVLEIAFDSVQKSNRHGSGFALRFPRIKYIRHDKSVQDIDTLDKVRRMYENQVHVKSG